MQRKLPQSAPATWLLWYGNMAAARRKFYALDSRNIKEQHTCWGKLESLLRNFRCIFGWKSVREAPPPKTFSSSSSTYLLTPWCRVLLEKLTGLRLVKKFPAFHGTRRFITALTSVRHLSLSYASPIQSIYPYPTSRRSILILSTHLRLGLPSGLFPSGFPTKTLYIPLSSSNIRTI